MDLVANVGRPHAAMIASPILLAPRHVQVVPNESTETKEFRPARPHLKRCAYIA